VFRYAILSFLLLIAAGAGRAQQVTNMAGNWQITALSTPYGLNISATGPVGQTGTLVTGQLTATGTPCATVTPFSGTLTGASLRLNVNVGGQTVVYSGTVAASGNSASGTYSAPEGGCTAGDFGTWSGTRSAAGVPTPVINSGGVVNGASFDARRLAAGAIASLFGTALGAATTLARTLPLPSPMANVSVQVNGIDAPLFYVSSTQFNFQVPWQVLGQSQVTVAVNSRGLLSATQTVRLDPAAPGIFTVSSSGSGQGVVQIANSSVFAAPAGSIAGVQTRPAARGDFLTIYCTGLGDVDNRPANGAAAPSNPLATAKVTPTVTIGGVAATVTFAGLTPGFVGLYQVNVQVPQSAPSGNAVELVVRSGEDSNTVTIAVQ
jgi:uncharacterized protein (TIGR03437 family)